MDQIAMTDRVFPVVRRNAMGCEFEIYLCGTDRDHLIAIGEEALDEISRLDRQLSHYRDDSDIARINRHARQNWVTVEPDLYNLLCRCRDWHAASDGAFDITAGPLVRLWGFHKGDNRVPNGGEIAETMNSVCMHRMLFDDEKRMVYFASSGLELNLGAVGKGYALDKAAEILRLYGVEKALLQGGHSTILAIGEHPEGGPWTFDIRNPETDEVIETCGLIDAALSTSGDEEQFFVQNGVRYSHILDPRTGQPVQNMRRVCVACPNAAESDALSTALFVRGFEDVESMLGSRKDVRVTMVVSDESGIRVKRFPDSNNE